MMTDEQKLETLSRLEIEHSLRARLRTWAGDMGILAEIEADANAKAEQAVPGQLRPAPSPIPADLKPPTAKERAIADIARRKQR